MGLIEWLQRWLLALLDGKSNHGSNQPTAELPPTETLLQHIYNIAAKELGEIEWKSGDNPRILEYHAAASVHRSMMEQELPWCSSFACWVLKQAGVQSTGSAWAKSYLDWGQPLTTPSKGCVVVMRRGADNGHVGFYDSMSADGKTIYLLGGNQNNAVCIKGYPVSDVLAYRAPKEMR